MYTPNRMKNERPKASDSRFSSGPGTGISLILLGLAVLAVCLPFIFKAFRMDDTFFVWLGQVKLDDPWALGLADHGYEGRFFPVYLDTHPPLFTSFVALLLAVSGGASEAGLHLGFAMFPLLAAFSMFFLARRFTDSPLVPALLLVVTPGFMVMSQSVMTDIPALALWLASVASYIYAVDREDGRLLALAAAAVSLAVLTTYQSLSLLPLLFLYTLLRRRISVHNLLPLAAGLLVFLAIVAFYLAQTGNLPKLSYSIGVNLTASFIANKILAILSVIGGAVILPLFMIAGLLKGRREYLVFSGIFVLLLGVFLYRASTGQYTAVAAMLQGIFYAAGALAVYRFINTGADSAFSGRRSGRDLDNIFLILWIGGVIAYTLVLLPYASTRYLLTLFPPVILMFVRYARSVFPGKRSWLRFSVAMLAVTALMGLAVSLADYRLAGVYRDFGGSWPRQLAQDGHKVWFAGEFGLRYYLEESGATYLTADDNSPRAGDYVVVSRELIAHFLSPELEDRLELEQSIGYDSSWPVRVSDPGSQAGFYDQFHGYLPWSLSAEPVETIDIYRVTR